MKKINSRTWIRAAIGSGIALIILVVIILESSYFYWHHYGLMNLLILLSLITFVISFGVVIAAEFSSIAAEKGYTGKKYFWFTFLVPAVGILMVIALPDRRNAMAPVNNAVFESNELPEL